MSSKLERKRKSTYSKIMIVFMETHQKYLLELVSEFSEVTEYEIKIWKSIVSVH